jgi:hypothetical protein
MGKITLQAFLVLVLLIGNINASSTTQLEFLQTPNTEVTGLSFEKLDDPYFQISEISVTDLDATEGEVGSYQKENVAGQKDLGTIIMSLEKLIAFGTKVWEIIKKGKPVVNVNLAKPVSVLPLSEEGRDTIFRMSGWSAPKSRRYRLDYKNGFGMKVISFDYTVHFQYNGAYEGKGKYITGLTISASNISVSWGFEFNASSEMMTISNRGSLDNPTAAATMKIDYRASSVFSNVSSSENFHVTGSGEIIKF